MSEVLDEEDQDLLPDDNGKGEKQRRSVSKRTCVSLIVGAALVCGLIVLSLIVFAATRELLSPTVISVAALSNWSAVAAPRVLWLPNGDFATLNGSSWQRSADASVLLDSTDGAAQAVFSPDFRFSLVPTAVQSLFRHSFRAEFDLFDTSTQRKLPSAFAGVTLRHALFDTLSSDVAIVDDNLNILVVSASNWSVAVRVTSDGAPNQITNGVQCWLYEEEIYSSASAMRFRGQFLAFLRSDETMVPLRTLPIYSSDRTDPDHWQQRYSMVGDPLPVVSLRVWDRAAGATVLMQTGPNAYIVSFDFVDTLNGGDLFVQTMPRKQDSLQAYSCKPATGVCTLLYSRQAVSLPWLDAMPVLWHDDSAFQIEQLSKERVVTRRRISALDAPIDLQLPFRPISLIGFDAAGSLWFTCAFPDSTSSRVCIGDTQMIGADVAALSFSREAPSFTPLMTSASLSPNGTLAVVHYGGPAVPFSAIVTTSPFSTKRVLETNAVLREQVASAKLATKTFFNVTLSDDFETTAWILNEAAARNGIVFTTYGGPDSTFVTHRFGVGINDVIATQLGVAVVGADVGGAGSRGVDFLRRNAGLGNMAAVDSNTIMQWAKVKFRARTIGIYGWSFGGHVAVKTLTLDTRPDFAIAIAPVVDWRLYDAAYTERYSNVDPNAVVFNETSCLGSACARIPPQTLLLMHGTGDDNVHYLNSAMLNECLQKAGVMFDEHSFINKQHGISGDGAREMLYAKMLAFINSKVSQ
jgi:dipeptidyl-peptidase-4